MGRKWNSFFLCLGLLLFAWGAAVPAQDDRKMHPFCPYCGMDRQEYAHSRMLIEYAEDATSGVCSIHCAVSEISVSRDKRLAGMRVADYYTRDPVAEEFVSMLKITFPVLLDPDSKIARRYGVLKPPCTFILDRDSVIRAKIIGQVDGPVGPTYEKFVTPLLNRNPG
jgi:peroxiredoxin